MNNKWGTFIICEKQGQNYSHVSYKTDLSLFPYANQEHKDKIA